MIDALHISESGMRATQKWIDLISNNIANIQTAGFKASRANFNDLISIRSNSDGANPLLNADINKQVGAGTVFSRAIQNFSMGNVQPTDSSLDIFIQGEGFIELILEDGTSAYTRLGRLKISENGQLVTAEGHQLAVDIELPPDAVNIQINHDGMVSATQGEAQERIDFGQILLTRIGDPDELEAIGNGLFITAGNVSLISQHPPGQDGVGRIESKGIEMSNVDLVEEMANLVMAQRAYQLNARIIQAADQVLETVNNLRR